MEAFTNVIAGINKTFFVTSDGYSNGQTIFRMTCVYVLYLKDETVKIFSAVVPTNHHGKLKYCHQVVENIVKGKITTYLYGRFNPIYTNPAAKVTLIGQKGVKTFATFDSEIEIENHSHCTWRYLGGYKTTYTIILKHITGNNVIILIGHHVGSSSMGESVRLARQDAEEKYLEIEAQYQKPASTLPELPTRDDKCKVRRQRFGSQPTFERRLKYRQQRFGVNNSVSSSTPKTQPKYRCSEKGREPNLKDEVDFDMADEQGRPIYPPIRTKGEEDYMKREMDDELDAYFGREGSDMIRVTIDINQADGNC